MAAALAACGSSGPHLSKAEILTPPAGTTPVYATATSSVLAQYERAALTDTTTTRDVVAFVPRSPPAQYMALGTCGTDGVETADAVKYATAQGGVFRLSRASHVKYVAPLSMLGSATILTDDGYVGVVCAGALAAASAAK